MISESSSFQSRVFLLLEATHIHILDRSNYLANITQIGNHHSTTDGWGASRRRMEPRVPEETRKSWR
jgi:hypothetical protein